MALDLNGHLLILDRGATLTSGQPTKTAVIDVQMSPTFKVASRVTLDQVLEPVSLLVLANGDLVIGDAREQNAAVPADLVYVNRATSPWAQTRLLAGLPAGQNPLVAPVALGAEDAAHWYVLDLGLKAYNRLLDPALTSFPFCRSIAVPAAVYRVTRDPPAVIRACTTGQLVFPTGMVLDQGALYVCDRGEYSDPDLAQELMRVWRTQPHEFGVIVYFPERDPDHHKPELRQILQNVRDIVAREKPAHTLATVLSAV
jgi:hypothetical protein